MEKRNSYSIEYPYNIGDIIRYSQSRIFYEIKDITQINGVTSLILMSLATGAKMDYPIMFVESKFEYLGKCKNNIQVLYGPKSKNNTD